MTLKKVKLWGHLWWRWWRWSQHWWRWWWSRWWKLRRMKAVDSLPPLPPTGFTLAALHPSIPPYVTNTRSNQKYKYRKYAICLESKIQMLQMCTFIMNKDYTQKWCMLELELKIQIHKISRKWKSKMSIIQNNWIIIQTCFWCRAGAKPCFRTYHSFYILEIENWRQHHPGKVLYFSSQVNLKHLFDKTSSRQKIISKGH